MAAAAAAAVTAIVDGMLNVEDELADILDGGETEGDLLTKSFVGVVDTVDIDDVKTSLLALLPFTTVDRVHDCSGDTISVIFLVN